MLIARGLVVTLAGRRVLDGFDLDVPDRQVVSVLGPSGSGKSTLLRALAGLQRLEAGTITWDGRSLNSVAPHRRGFGLMFQDFALFPHKTVAGNVAFGLEMAGISPADTQTRVREALSWVGLAGFEARAVGRLSGGEQQRVALARAMAPRPRLLMLDEPLGSLDRVLRERLLLELRELFEERGMTALYVTHDHEEAFAVSDRLVLMQDGRPVQTGQPGEVWRRPASEWAARFLGFTNIVEAELRGGEAQTAWGRFRVSSDTEAARPGKALPEGRVKLVLRPDAFRLLGEEGQAGEGAEAGGRSAGGRGGASSPLQARIVSRSFRGGHYLLKIHVEGGPVLEAELAADRAPGVGEAITVGLDQSGVVVLREEE